MSVTVCIWNIQGRRRPDLASVAAYVRDSGAEVVLVQEVQWLQARSLAHRLGWTATWAFKHWPVVAWPEGLAVLTPRPPLAVHRVTLSAGEAFWSWKRRVGLRVDVARTGPPLTVVDIHLGAGVGEAERVRQAGVALTVAPRRATVIAGDANAGPTSGVIRAFADAGFDDAWARVGVGPGATNWRTPDRSDVPTQRIDYVFASDDLAVVAATLPITTGSSPADIASFGAISDHLPLTVVIAED